MTDKIPLSDMDLISLTSFDPKHELPATRAVLELIEWRRAARSIGCADPAYLWRILEGLRAGEVESLARQFHIHNVHRGMTMAEAFEHAEELIRFGDKHAAEALAHKTEQMEKP